MADAGREEGTADECDGRVLGRAILHALEKAFLKVRRLQMLCRHLGKRAVSLGALRCVQMDLPTRLR